MFSSDPSSLIQWLPQLVREPYWHPDQIKSKPAPEGLKHELWWPLLKCLRLPLRRDLPFSDPKGRRFTLCLLPEMLPALHRLDRAAAHVDDSQWGQKKVVPWANVQQSFKATAQMDEAVFSARVSGLQVDLDSMRQKLRLGQHPANQTEAQVVDLYRILRKPEVMAARPITVEALLELNRSLTQSTGSLSTGLRQETLLEDVIDSALIPGRLAQICAFAEGGSEDEDFLHPILRCLLATFWLLHDRPFASGNGRTARMLLIWAALRAGYPMFGSMAVSVTLAKTGLRLSELLRRVMTDECDATYFVAPLLEIVMVAYDKAVDDLRDFENELQRGRHAWNPAGFLNERQEGIVLRALHDPGTFFTIEAHRASHDLAYATARADLLRLEQIGLMVKRQRGKSFVFETAPDWEQKLKLLSGSA